jgi:multicomponent Na+:H+ antiporter subunit D
VLVSLLTLFSIFKVWIAVFWSPADKTPDGRPIDHAAPLSPVGAAVQRLPAPLLMIVPTAILATLTLAIGVGAGPLYELSDRAAADLIDPAHYIDAVLHP